MSEAYHVDTLGCDTGDEAGREVAVRRARQSQPDRNPPAPGKPGKRRTDALGRRGVELLGSQAAHVVGLEDGREIHEAEV